MKSHPNMWFEIIIKVNKEVIKKEKPNETKFIKKITT